MKVKKMKYLTSSPFAKVWTSLLTTTTGIIASLISAIAGATEIFNLSSKIGVTFFAAFATIIISVLFTSILVRQERGSSQIAKLKDDLENAYLEALEISALNPFRGELR